MIKTNLLNSIETTGTGSEQTQEGNKGKNKLPLIVLLVVAIAGALFWFKPWVNSEAVEDKMAKTSTSKPLAKPEKPLPSVEAKHHGNVEEVVRDIHTEAVPQPPKVVHITEDLASTRASLAWGLQFLKGVSKEGVEYSDVVLKTPNYFYLRGIVDDAGLYRNLKAKLKKGATPLKATAPKGVGIAKVAQEFQFYGEWKQSLKKARLSKAYFSKAESKKLFSQLKAKAKKAGINLQNWKQASSKPHGKYKRTITRSKINGEYQNLVSFVKAINSLKIPIGLLRLSLHANEKETMSATVDWVYYTK